MAGKEVEGPLSRKRKGAIDDDIAELIAENRKLRHDLEQAFKIIDALQAEKDSWEALDDDDVDSDAMGGTEPMAVTAAAEDNSEPMPTQESVLKEGASQKQESENILTPGANPAQGIGARENPSRKMAGAIGKKTPKTTGRPKAANKGARVKSKSIPDLNLYNANVRNVCYEIRALLGRDDFVVKILGRSITNVRLLSIADYNTVKTMLKEKKYSFYTFSPRSETPYVVVIDGIADTFEESEVKTYLSGMKFRLNVQRVTKLGGCKWLVHLFRDSDIASLYKCTFMLFSVVSVRKDRKVGVTQCRNCQRFGHVAANCGMPYRCCKCGKSHGAGNCTYPKKGEEVVSTPHVDPLTGAITREIQFVVHCVNCGIDGHASSAIDCPVRQRLLRSRTEARKRQTKADKVSFPRGSGAVQNGLTFAGALKGGGAGAPKGPKGSSMANATAGIDAVDADCRQIFGSDFFTCVSRVGDFSAEYGKCKDQASKSRALLGLMITIRRGQTS